MIGEKSFGSPTYFISHAWKNLFVDLVAAVAADLECRGARDETFLWLDIFAINQDDSGGKSAAMAELDDGKTLAAVIALSLGTKVVLDKERVAPLKRLWYGPRHPLAAHDTGATRRLPRHLTAASLCSPGACTRSAPRRCTSFT